MNIIRAYINSWKFGFSHLNMAGMMYIISLSFALILALPFFEVVRGSIGNSLELNKLMQGADYTIISDFLRTHGFKITPLIEQIKWLVFAYWGLNIFFNGGIFARLKGTNEDTELQDFLAGGVRYFWRMFRISLAFIVVHALIAFFVYGILAGFLSKGLDNVASEKVFIDASLIAFGIHIFFASIIMVWADYTRAFLVSTNSSAVWRSMGKGFSFMIGHFAGTYLLFITNALILIALFYGYWHIADVVGMTSLTAICGMLLLQQLFIFSRIIFRITNFGCAWFYLTTTNPIEPISDEIDEKPFVIEEA